MLFGVTTKGPQADAIVNAVMTTLEKTGQPRDHEGEGFMNVDAAYQKLVPSRAAIDRWNRVSSLRADAGARSARLELAGGSLSDVKGNDGALNGAEEELRALSAAYPLLASDPKRADRLRDELDAAEYKSLLRRVVELEQTSAAYTAAGRGSNRMNDMWDDLLAFNEKEIEPQLAAAKARLRQILRESPRVTYDATGRLGRWWLRVTGRGPSA
jgi:hypothetical protein